MFTHIALHCWVLNFWNQFVRSYKSWKQQNTFQSVDCVCVCFIGFLSCKSVNFLLHPLAFMSSLAKQQSKYTSTITKNSNGAFRLTAQFRREKKRWLNDSKSGTKCDDGDDGRTAAMAVANIANNFAKRFKSHIIFFLLFFCVYRTTPSLNVRNQNIKCRQAYCICGSIGIETNRTVTFTWSWAIWVG